MSIDALTDLAAILRERGGEVSLRWVGWEDCWVACWRYRGAQLVADGADLEETIARLVRRIEETTVDTESTYSAERDQRDTEER
jgi:hypothetical protein